MHHTFISYASEDRSRASAVARTLRTAGSPVWIDIGDEDGSLEPAESGIPAGRPHWDVIIDAIRGADSILILGTSDWCASNYCRREFQAALGLGKRIVVLADGPCSEEMLVLDAPAIHVVDETSAATSLVSHSTPELRAHTRLVDRMARPDKPRRRLTRLLLGVPGARDAQLVLTSASKADFDLTPDQYVEARRLVGLQSARSRDLSWAGIVTIFVLIAGVVLSVLGQRSAQADNARALRERTQALALSDAQKAIATRGRDSAAASQAATNAAATYPSRETRSAASIVASSARQIQVIPIPHGVPLVVSLTPGGTHAVVGFADRAVVVDTSSSQSTVIQLGDYDQKLALGDSGQTLGVVSDGTLNFVDVATSSQQPWDDARAVTALTVGPTGNFVWGTAEGLVFTGTFGQEPRRIARVDGAVLALAADRHGVSAATDDFVLHRLDRNGERLWQKRVLDASVSPPPSDAQRASLVRCGSVWHGTYEWHNDAALLVNRETARYWATSKRAEAAATSRPVRGLGCDLGDGSWGADTFTSSVSPWPPSSHWPAGISERGDNFIAVGMDPTGDFVATAKDDGRLEVRSLRQTAWTGAGAGLRLAFPLAGGTVTVSESGPVTLTERDIAAGRQLGELPSGEISGAVVDSRDRAYLSIGRTIYRVSSKRVRRLANLPGTIAYHSMQLTAERDGLVAVVGGMPYLIDFEGTWTRVPVDLSRLDSVEVVQTVAASKAGLVLATNLGRLLALDPSGRSVAETRLPAAGGTFTAISGGRVIAAGSDGWIRAFDLHLQPVDSTSLGASAVSLHVGPDRQVLVGVFGAGAYILLDAATLDTRQYVVEGVWRTSQIVPSATWSSVVALREALPDPSSTNTTPSDAVTSIDTAIQDQAAMGTEGSRDGGPFSASTWTETMNLDSGDMDEVDAIPLQRD